MIRTAQTAAEIVRRFLRLGNGAERRRVERAILQVVESAAVEGVGAAARSGGDVADLPELRIVADALHLHFRDALRRRKQLAERTVGGGAYGGDAVERYLGLRRQAALQREVVTVVALDSRLVRQEPQRAGTARSAVVRRQFQHLLRIERGRDRGTVRGNHGRRRRDADGLTDLTEIELHIDAHGLPGIQFQFRCLEELEAGGFRRNGVDAGLQVQRFVVSLRIRQGRAGDVLSLIGDRDLCLRHHCAGRIGHRPQDGAESRLRQ